MHNMHWIISINIQKQRIKHVLYTKIRANIRKNMQILIIIALNNDLSRNNLIRIGVLKMYYKYLKYILEHKKNVFIECIKIAMQHKGRIRRKLIIHSFTHDLSKFLPCEFIPYARYFYGYCHNETSCVELEKYYDYESLNNGHSCLSNSYLKTKEAFNKAWEHHYTHNKHHEDYWQGKDMPYLYIMQLIADWKGMARKFGDTAQEYYLKNYKKFNMTYQTRLDLEMNLNINPSPYHNYGHTLEDFANMYDEETYNNNFDWLKDKYKVDTYKLLKE